MTSWVIESLNDADRNAAKRAVSENLLADLGELGTQYPDSFNFTSRAYEFAVLSLLEENESDSDLRDAAELAFETGRAIALPPEPEARALQLLRTACYGVIADRTPDVARYLRGGHFPNSPPEGMDWGPHIRTTVYRLWLLLLRKNGWPDLDTVLEEVASLRNAQENAESAYLAASESARTEAWYLIATYHLSKAAEILSVYSAQGTVDRSFDIREQLQSQFDRSIAACERAELLDFLATNKLLAATAERMVANSIWSVTRAVNSRVSQFVNQLVDRARQNPVFELLPPQRITLRENGLLGSGHRSVVVSLPTSSGKTLIAQFRILQALNQFDNDKGWVAYIAPTRALVNQICARLRRDFTPLGIVVERVSPALEIDGVEAEILAEMSTENAFRVLVGTPEKIDLLLRGGWEAKIGRPLTLVVVDEAHNLSSSERGLKLELLLATINRECRHSQFLLLTPFITNSDEVARWLAPDSHADLTVEFDWRPNDRAIAIAKPVRGEKAGEYGISLETVHTSKKTVEIDRNIELCYGRELGLIWSKVNNSLSNVAAVAASCLNRRGTVIVVAGQIPHTWSIARTLSSDPAYDEKLDARISESGPRLDEDINFVSDFVSKELGADFELVELLKKRIGVHHTGISDETRILMEWLVERGELDTLVSTTTIAQGVNFPVSGVVLAAHQYPYGDDMTPEDFWNLAGRAGRADQIGTGIIALAANNDERASILRRFVERNISQLNSTLIDMVQKALDEDRPLELHALFWMKEWSAFLQYLAHTYRQIGNHAEFANQIEQVLRGSLGFQKLRQENIAAANGLVAAVHDYASVIRGKPLALVDSTGFSWESVSRALAGAEEAGLRGHDWDPSAIFSDRDTTLQRAFGVLFTIPEIRQELGEVTGGQRRNGDLLARIVKDWVEGASIPDLAEEYFTDKNEDRTNSITRTCRAVYGKLTLTASWGLAALQSLTVGEEIEEMSTEDRRAFQNLPSRIYYGVNSDEAIDLRLLGVPRNAAQPLAARMQDLGIETGVRAARRTLQTMTNEDWEDALGDGGATYRRAWRVLEGLE